MCKMNEKGMMLWGRRKPEKIVKGVIERNAVGRAQMRRAK